MRFNRSGEIRKIKIGFLHMISDFDEGIYLYLPEQQKWEASNEDVWSNNIVQDGKVVKSYRAFIRNLKQIAKRQPELKGHNFRLCSLFYKPNTKKKSLDIIRKIR